MELNTILLIVCTILYILIAWQVYVGLNNISTKTKQANTLSAVFWPGLIVISLIMLVMLIIMGIGLSVFLTSTFVIDLIKTLFVGKQIEEPVPELDKLEGDVE